MSKAPKPVTPYVLQQTETFSGWFRKLRDIQAKAAIIRRLDRASAGNLGDVKPVGDGVFEMHIMQGAGYRLYCVHRPQAIVVLLCGGDKASQVQDIASAKKLAGEMK